jgi:hypothetical protein
MTTLHDDTFEHDCRALMDALPATVADRALPHRGTFTWEKLNQRAVDVLYLALAHSLAGAAEPEPAPVVGDEQLSAMLGLSLAATIRLGGKK